MMHMVLIGGGVYQYIIYISDEVLVQQVLKYIIDKGLENTWSIGKTKRHD